MATTRELKDRINSIESTMKITNAMYLISSTKMRKARSDLAKTEPYFFTLQAFIERMIRHLPENYHHPYLDLRQSTVNGTGTAAIIAITADKGLAGAYNHNVIKLTEELLGKHEHTKLFVVGEVGRNYFLTRDVDIEESFHYTAQNPTLHRARVITRRMLELYESREIDEVYIVYTEMVNSMEMEAKYLQLLPLDQLRTFFRDIPMVANYEEFQLFPSPKDVVDNVIPDFLNGFIYGALVEAFCAEQNARMTSMDAANRNGQQLKADLTLQYNRVRQAQITQEITEIAAGAKAQRAQREARRRKQG